MTIWQILELEKTTDLKKIKQAYAVKLKQHKPEVDPEGFQRLRAAFELAKKFAANEYIEPEFDDLVITETEQKNESFEAENSYDEASLFDKPQYLAFHLLYMLSNGYEEEALEKFKEFNQKGLLDNLESAEEFQEYLALRLIDKVSQAPKFTAYLIDYNDWQNHPAIQTESPLGVALRCLIMQTAYYRFLQELKRMSQVSDQDEAREKGWDWNQCYAAKILLSSQKPRGFFLDFYFSRKKRKAILDLLETINNSRLTSTKTYFDDNAIVWLTEYKNKKDFLLRCGYFSAIFLASFSLISYKHGIFRTRLNTPPQETTPAPANAGIAPTTSTNIVITFADHQGKKLSGDTQYILHIPKVKNLTQSDLVWNIVLLDKNYQVLNHPKNNLPLVVSNNNSVLIKNQDDSVDLHLQSTKPPNLDKVNWFITPKNEFIIMGQFYWKNSADVISNWEGLTLTKKD